MERGSRTILALALAVATIVMPVLTSTPRATAAPEQARTEQVLESFGGSNGAGPLSGVSVGAGGVLYGTTVFGGRYGGGCVFALTPHGSTYTERILFSFSGGDGAKPSGGVVADAHGDLFGATFVGGAYNQGTVFELVPERRDGYAETVLYSFTGFADGEEPIGAPVLDDGGDVFGVTQFGGTGGHGVVYEIRPSAVGSTEEVLHSFANTAGQPQAGLTMAGDGALYGTLYGFSEMNQFGTVFRLKARDAGPVYTDLYDFHGGADGANPLAALVVDDTGTIYGSTEYGGVDDNGTVFSLSPTERGYREMVLHSFTRGRGGVIPESPLLRTGDGDLYGTANIGGIGCHGIGCGSVYELVRGRSAYRFRVIYRFKGPPDGAEPQWSGLAAGPSNELFGTTRSGGTRRTCSDGGPGGVSGCGTVYEITG